MKRGFLWGTSISAAQAEGSWNEGGRGPVQVDFADSGNAKICGRRLFYRKADGIITSSDRAAFGAMKALGKVGYYAPEDVKLISFDNSPYSTMASPSITSLDRNPASLAGRACEILLDLIAGKDVQKENIISVSLVERDSTR